MIRSGGLARSQRQSVALRRKSKRVRVDPRPPTTAIARLPRELNDARDQLVAMSEVLHAISRSKFELSAVLESAAEAAARLCRADGAVISNWTADFYRFAAGQPGAGLSGNRAAVDMNGL